MKKKTLIILLIIAAVILIPLGWYLGSPLFIDEIVDEQPLAAGEMVAMASFVGADSFHQVSGVASVVSSEESSYLRLESFESTNGPDLYVYLSKDLQANDFIDLGRLKGNIGNQNYDLQGSSTEDYPYVLIWCKRFGVLFGSAKFEGI